MAGGGGPPSAAVFEKLGAFFLGRVHDPDRGELTDDLLLYDAKDLTTHAVCVGMTGSGKTGLCLGLLEEAAIDGIPAIAIDPKGDLGNLLLTFPNLQPSDFRPWVDPGAATRKGQTPDEFARATAETWKNGLASWGQDGARIQRMRDAADIAIYTPGSDAGLQLTVLRSFKAPPPELDGDGLRERIGSAVSGLLALLGIDADPVRSREHIFLSTVLDHHWRRRKDLDIGALIQAIQQPPIDRIGVMDLESVYPAGDRFELAMRLNNLLASPGFAAWMQGEPLDIKSLLWTSEGKPRISILSIAHLSEAERMFFVTILLNEMVAWMRTQSGTTSLRALLYMDEVFGFFPPTANPPSKRPMLTLLKQARAYGVGCVLATQNPVDLDYKGLSNAGTWFLGRLQTERDKARVLDGLEGASASSGVAFDRRRMETILSGLKSRVFLMNNVHDKEPVLFGTRWVLSYLRGPLTRSQISTLMADRKRATPAAQAAVAAARPTARKQAAAELAKPERPVVAPGVEEVFVPVTRYGGGDAKLLYRPSIFASASLHYANATLKVDHWTDVAFLSPLPASGRITDPWKKAERLPAGFAVSPRVDGTAAFGALPTAAGQAKSYASWEKQLKTHLYRACDLSVWKCTKLKLVGEHGESERDFRVRVRDAAHEARDVELAKLRKRYEPKLERLEVRIRRAEEKVAAQEAQYSEKKTSTMISIGSTILGAIFGRKKFSAGTVGGAASTMRRAGAASREKGDIKAAQRQLKDAQEALKELNAEFEAELEAKRDAMGEDAYEVTSVPVRPRKTDIQIAQVALAWTPWWVSGDGIAEPGFGE